MYFDGRGVQVNKPKAYAYFLQGAGTTEEGKAMLEKVTAEMTAEEISAGRKIAEEMSSKPPQADGK